MSLKLFFVLFVLFLLAVHVLLKILHQRLKCGIMKFIQTVGWVSGWTDCLSTELRHFLSVEISFSDLLIEGPDTRSRIISPFSLLFVQSVGDASWSLSESVFCFVFFAGDSSSVLTHELVGVEVMAQVHVVWIDDDTSRLPPGLGANMARVGGASMTHKSSLLIMIFYTITNMCLIILSVYGGIMLNSPTMIVVVFTLFMSVCSMYFECYYWYVQTYRPVSIPVKRAGFISMGCLSLPPGKFFVLKSSLLSVNIAIKTTFC